MFKKYKLKQELKHLYEKRDKLVRHLNNCVELSKFGYFTALGRSRIHESELELLEVNSRISELEGLV